MLVSTLIHVPILMMSFVPPPAPSVNCLLDTTGAQNDQQAVVLFTQAVHEYVELHRQLEAGLPPRAMSSDAEQAKRAADALAAAIRHDRPTLRTGKVFTPEVAAFLRRRIATAVRDVECDIANRLDEAEEAAMPWEPPPAVAGSPPWNFGHVTWPSIVWRLPLLPEELEYRFVGRNLVLFDVHANLVVDILENAGPSGEESNAPHADPCEAHPELAMCWS